MRGALWAWLVSSSLLVLLLSAPTLHPAGQEETVTLEVLLKTDDLALIAVAHFAFEATTPADAWDRFSPEVQATLRKWWADPNDQTVTKEEERNARAAVNEAVRAHNAPRLSARIEEFESQLREVAPGAELEGYDRSAPYSLHLVSASGVPTSAVARVAALSTVVLADLAPVYRQP